MTDRTWPKADEALLRIWQIAVATRLDWSDFDGRWLLDNVEYLIRVAHGDLPFVPYFDDGKTASLTWADFPRRGGSPLGEQPL